MRRCGLILVTAAWLLAGAQDVRADVSSALADTAKRAEGAMATLKAKFKTDLMEQDISEVALCIRKDGIFMTFGLNADHATGQLSDLWLVVPGIEGKRFEAELLGIDPRTNIGFVKAKAGEWKAIQFARTSALELGQMVTATGLTNPDYGYAPIYGVGYLSTVLRTPTRLALVTGGSLPGAGSPVFNKDGYAVGIVGRNQLFRPFETLTQQGVGRVMMRQTDECSTFVPVEEFVYSFSFPAGQWTRRLPWIGVQDFGPVSSAIRIDSGLTGPGAVVGTVFDGQPAAKAGLKGGDIIVGMNGQPLEDLATPEITARQAWSELMKLTPGADQTVKFDVVRGRGVKISVPVTLEPYPTRPAEAKRYVDKDNLGIAVREQVMLDKFFARQNQGARTELPAGLVVIIVGKNKPAYNASLGPDDVILKINGADAKTVQQFKDVVDKSVKDDKPISLVVSQKGETKPVTILPATKSK